jgi:hypothetical protein
MSETPYIVNFKATLDVELPVAAADHEEAQAEARQQANKMVLARIEAAGANPEHPLDGDGALDAFFDPKIELHRLAGDFEFTTTGALGGPDILAAAGPESPDAAHVVGNLFLVLGEADCVGTIDVAGGTMVDVGAKVLDLLVDKVCLAREEVDGLKPVMSRMIDFIYDVVAPPSVPGAQRLKERQEDGDA